MNKITQIYEGKYKRIFKTEDESRYLIEYKDDVPVFGIERRYSEGMINNKVTNHFMSLLESKGIATHYIEEVSDNETLIRKLRIIPVEVIVRNVAAGSLVKRFGFAEGKKLSRTILEFSYKDERLGDPYVNKYHIAAMALCSEAELEFMEKTALKVNEILSAYMENIGITLVDCKLEFGRDEEGNLFLADEISPESCRLWDSKTGEKLDKDRFRRNVDDVDILEETFHRLTGK